MNAESCWTVARFAGVRLDRRRRELTRHGVPQPLAPRAFDVLVALLEQRHRVMSKDELIARCWRGDPGSDGALARIVMQLRRSIDDIDGIGATGDRKEIIHTARGAGYRFGAPVELSNECADTTSRSNAEALAMSPRLALLPFVNDTGDAGFAWVELGLASMLGRSLESSVGVEVTALHEVLVALAGLPPDAALERRAQALWQHLDADLLVAARLGGNAGYLTLHFELQRRDGDSSRGSVAGADATALGVEASKRLAQWLLPVDLAARAEALDLGDAFLNETFARALHKSREGRLVEAAHLLDVVADSANAHPDVLLERATVHVALGAPRAAAEVETLRQLAHGAGNLALLASVGLLSSMLAGQRGEMLRAAGEAAAAATDAERAGRAELAVQCLIEAARDFGQCFDPRAAALLSRAIPQAERLGNRVLVRDAYHTAGRLRSLSSDWVGALRYHEAALTIADTMAEATRGPALSSVGWALLQLGRIEQGCDACLEAFRCARIGGAEPGLGDAAATAANGCIIARRMLDVAALYRQVQDLPTDQSLPMLIARELMCRAACLRLVGRIDEALACIEATLAVCNGNTVYETYCHIGSLRVLLYARRFEEMFALCTRLRRSSRFVDDPRLALWVERAEAFRDHLALGRTEQALARLHAILARLPLSEPQARMALDLAWLHLERGEPALAEPLLMPLQSWLEQSSDGALVQARLHHERGRFDAAVAEQQRFTERFAAAQTRFTRSLLERYRQAQRRGVRERIDRIELPLNLEVGMAPWVVRQLPAELGGPGSSAATGARS